MAVRSDRGQEIKRVFEHLRNAHDRVNFESYWEHAARLCYPAYNEFFRNNAKTSTPGQRKDQFIYDCTPIISVQRFTAIMKSLLMPRGRVWHYLRPASEKARRKRRNVLWTDVANATLYQKRYDPSANFDGQSDIIMNALGVFGTAPLFADRMGRGLRYKACFVGDIYYDENHQGIIDTAYRRFDLNARGAVQMFEDVPEGVQKQANSPEQQFDTAEYVHCVRPNAGYNPNKRGAKSFVFESVYIHLDSGLEVTPRDQRNAGGYNTFPYAISRYITGPYEKYGRGPAMTVLSEIEQLNAMRRTAIRASQKSADPPLLLADDGIYGGQTEVNLNSGGLNPGYVDMNGRPKIVPLMSGANHRENDVEMAYSRSLINDAFLVSLFQIMQDNPRMSATEAAIRAQEKGFMLAPTVGRQESELLGPLIQRELDVLIDSGEIDPPPDDLLEDGGLEVVYDNPLTRLAKAEENAGLQQTYDQYIQVAQIDMEAAKATGFNLAKSFRRMAENRAVPIDVFDDEQEVQQQQQANAAAQAQAQQAQLAPQVAKAAKDLAAAQQLRSEVA